LFRYAFLAYVLKALTLTAFSLHDYQFFTRIFVLSLHLQIFVEEIQNTFVRDDHANLAIACAAKESDPGGFSQYFPDLASRQTRRFSREQTTRRPSEITRRDSLTQELVRLKSIAQYQMGMTGAPSAFGGLDLKALAKQEIMTFTKVTVWAEYFNNMRKCWEPLLEKLVATVLYEKVLVFYVKNWCFVPHQADFIILRVLYV
jgi:hypothetical protein